MADRNWFVQSFIDPPTWDAAGWYGTGFLTAPDHSVPPAVVLMFGDGNAARRIFEDLRKRVGAEDEYEELRIAIVEGDIPGEEPGYSVHIGSHIEHILRRAKAEGHEIEPEYIYTFSRINRMNPEEDSPHLGNFKKSYSRHGFYGLMPGVGEGPAFPDKPPRLVPDLAITKKEVVFRRVQDIGPNDFDVVVLKRR